MAKLVRARVVHAAANFAIAVGAEDGWHNQRIRIDFRDSRFFKPGASGPEFDEDRPPIRDFPVAGLRIIVLPLRKDQPGPTATIRWGYARNYDKVAKSVN